MTDTNETQKVFFEFIEEGDEDICRTLWLGVILQAILDAKGKFGNVVSRNQARIWLEGRGGDKSDFATVCQLAGVDFEKTRIRCSELLATDSLLVDFRAMKQDKEKNRLAKNRRDYFYRAKRRERIRRSNQETLNNSRVVAGANDNLPRPANDNRCDHEFINQPTETKQ